MRKIKTKAEADEFYRVINSEIDKYVGWKIDPKNLKKYFNNKTKMKNFLTRIGLVDVDRIETIVKDVVEDREAGHKEGILKFENFLVKESIQFEESGIEHEKVLADLFHTSLSDVELVEQKTNRYKVSDMGKDTEVAIFSEQDINKFKDELLQQLIKDAKKDNLDLFQTDLELESGKKLKARITIPLNEILDEDKLKEALLQKIDEKKALDILTQWLNDIPIMKVKKTFQYHKRFHDYHIWLLISK